MWCVTSNGNIGCTTQNRDQLAMNSHQRVLRGIGTTLGASTVAVALLGCRCTENHDSLARTTGELEQLFDRTPDQDIEFDDGHELLVWEFHQEWPELGPSHYYYLGITEPQSLFRRMFLGECVSFGRFVSDEGIGIFSDRNCIGMSSEDVLALVGEQTPSDERIEVLKKLGWKHGAR